MTKPDALDRIKVALSRQSAASSDFDLSENVDRPANRVLRPCGVLVPLVERNGSFSVLLTKRSSALKHHPGQIAFPGGKVEDGDDGSVGAALREAEEEIGLRRSNVDVLGTLPVHETVTAFAVTPVVGQVCQPFEPVIDPGEVAEVFSVPLDFLADVSSFQVQSRFWRGVERKFYVVPYGPYYIWGATARILRGLAERLSV